MHGTELDILIVPGGLFRGPASRKEEVAKGEYKVASRRRNLQELSLLCIANGDTLQMRG